MARAVVLEAIQRTTTCEFMEKGRAFGRFAARWILFFAWFVWAGLFFNNRQNASFSILRKFVMKICIIDVNCFQVEPKKIITARFISRSNYHIQQPKRTASQQVLLSDEHLQKTSLLLTACSKEVSLLVRGHSHHRVLFYLNGNRNASKVFRQWLRRRDQSNPQLNITTNKRSSDPTTSFDLSSVYG